MATKYKMIFIVREDLKMGKGKIASQCCHACLGLYKKVSNISKYKNMVEEWERTGQKKITLKCKDLKEMDKIKEKAMNNKIIYEIIQDAGLTQIESGSITVMSLFAEEHTLDNMVRHLKLL